MQRKMTGQLPSDDEALLNTMLGAARRMNTLIDDLLLYRNAAKTEEGPAPGVDAASVVSEVTDGLTGQINDAGAMVTMAGALPSVAIHRSALAQLFQNLISNSIKYRSEATPRVQVSAQTERGWCVFSVTDNGLGISRSPRSKSSRHSSGCMDGSIRATESDWLFVKGWFSSAGAAFG